VSGGSGASGSGGPGPGGEGGGGPGSGGQIRLRLDLGYDGSQFHGWAAQPALRTVQGVLSGALGLLLRLPQPPDLTVAGRTDAGVHARGQVAHVDVPGPAWLARTPVLTARLNKLLPDDLRVHAIQAAPDGFDARFSALWRRYSYRICDLHASADPLRRHDTLWHRRPVDLDLMNEAAATCLGEHDFAAFCRRRPGASTVRELLRFDWHRYEDGVLAGTVRADAFCHNMVRALAGAVLAVGDGRKPVAWLAEVLAAGVRDPAATVLPPHPLCLEQVGYPPDGELSARALLTRRVRGTSSLDRDEPPAAPDQAAGGGFPYTIR
jgi:tRNA pseudouridine38-40 synthase